MTAVSLMRMETDLATQLDALPRDPLPEFSELNVPELPAPNQVRIKVTGVGSHFVVSDPESVQRHDNAESVIEGWVTQARWLMEKVPKSIVATSRYAQVLLTAGRPEAAAAAAAEALELRSEDSPFENAAVFVAARILAILGRTEEAERALQSLPPNGPWVLLSAAIAERNGNVESALVRTSNATTADALAYKGYLKLRIGRPQEALGLFRESSRGAGLSPSLLVNESIAFALLGSPKKAVKAAKQAVALAPFDRAVSFNLAHHLRASGVPGSALDELARFTQTQGNDALIASAKAQILVDMGEVSRALRELRRATSHTDDPDTSPQQGQLRANISVLLWATGKINRVACVQNIMAEIEKCGPDVALVTILASMTVRRADLAPILQLVDVLAINHPEEQLRELRWRLAYGLGNYKDAANLCISWASTSPLDPRALASEVVQIGQSLDDYERASETGLEYLRRFPHETVLANNIAFALAFARRFDEAEKVLLPFEVEDVYLTATRGLIELGRGRVAEGLAGYDRAAEIAREHDGRSEEIQPFMDVMRAQETLAIFHFGLEGSELIPPDLKYISAPEGWEDDLRVRPLIDLAKRLFIPMRVH
jgi:tetratricopeptide (TPR) repeat protein